MENLVPKILIITFKVYDQNTTIKRQKLVNWIDKHDPMIYAACKLGGAEFQMTPKVGQTVLARLMNSQIWHLPSGSVETGFRKGTMAFLAWGMLSPSSCLDARPFTPSLYATGAFQASTLVLELRGSR